MQMQFKLVAKNTRSFAMPTQLLVWMLVAALDPSSMQSFFLAHSSTHSIMHDSIAEDGFFYIKILRAAAIFQMITDWEIGRMTDLITHDGTAK
jgi:hypothetical protein